MLLLLPTPAAAERSEGTRARNSRKKTNQAIACCQ